MKAVIINSTDILGGAGLAGYTLCKALNDYTDFNAEILCGSKGSSDENVTQILSGKTQILHNFLKHILAKMSQEHLPSVYFTILKMVKAKKPDIINLHNIHGGYFPYPIISKLSKIAPIVISMQDMWYLTGHCAFSYDCTKWQRGCFKCPHKDWYPQIFIAPASFHWKKKKKLFQNNNITFVTCSQWLKNESAKSPILSGRPVLHIYNPIDTDVLKPIERDLARYLLDVPKNKNILVFGASDVDNPRKGFQKLIQSLPENFATKNNIFMVIMGKDRNRTLRQMPKYLPYKHIENASHPLVRAIVYGTADVFVFPTLADNLSNMLVESLSCGRTVVTFDVGGSGEIIINNKTGYLARYADYADFQNGIELLLQNSSSRKKMEQECRFFAVSKFSMKSCAEEYSRIFRKVTA